MCNSVCERENANFPSPPRLPRVANKNFPYKRLLKVIFKSLPERMTPNALIRVMPRGSVRLGPYFAKCYIKYQMKPIRKSLLAQERRRTKGWEERVEWHLSADKAGYSHRHGAIRRLVISSSSATSSSNPPQATVMILGKPRSLSTSLLLLCRTVAIALPPPMEELWGGSSQLGEGRHMGHLQILPSADHISSHERLLSFTEVCVYVCYML